MFVAIKYTVYVARVRENMTEITIKQATKEDY